MPQHSDELKGGKGLGHPVHARFHTRARREVASGGRRSDDRPSRLQPVPRLSRPGSLRILGRRTPSPGLTSFVVQVVVGTACNHTGTAITLARSSSYAARYRVRGQTTSPG